MGECITIWEVVEEGPCRAVVVCVGMAAPIVLFPIVKIEEEDPSIPVEGKDSLMDINPNNSIITNKVFRVLPHSVRVTKTLVVIATAMILGSLMALEKVVHRLISLLVRRTRIGGP